MKNKKLLLGALALSALTFAPNSAQADTIIVDSTNSPYTLDHDISDQSSTQEKGYGGAIYNEGTVTITGESIENAIKFETNKATYGGAIFNYAASSLTLTNTGFAGNIAENSGGAVLNIGNVTISTSTFGGSNTDDGNSAIQGGAIQNEGSLTLKAGNKFISNRATLGGAIVNVRTLNITENEFASNSATHGGAIFNQGALTITGTDFASNSTTSYGGAIYNHSAGVIKNSTGLNFEGNKASNGGAIINFGTVEELANSTFTSNKATTGFGGAIYNYNKASITATDLTFKSNTATGSGGAIYNFGELSLSANDLENSLFEGNTAGTFGGAIANLNKLELSNVKFVKNTAGTAGGAILDSDTTSNTSGTTTIKDSYFENNSTTGGKGSYGGAIAHASSSLLDVDNSTFVNNSSGKGGAIISTRNNEIKDATVLKVANSTFSGNQAVTEGGAIWSGSKTDIYNTTFDSNHTTDTTFDDSKDYNYNSEGGGAIFVGSNSVITVDKSKFTNNTSGTVGGAIATRSNATNATSSLTISNSEFTGNTAEIRGGAIISYIDFTVDKSSFENNYAGQEGGAIYSLGSLTVSGSTFAGNGSIVEATDETEKTEAHAALLKSIVSSDVNTAVAVADEGSDTSSNSDAKSSIDGGAIFNGGTLDLNGSTFTDNTALFGGAVYNEGTLTVSGSTFGKEREGNTGNHGGAIYNAVVEDTENSGIVTIKDNSNISYNTAYEGGALYNEESGKVEITGSTISNNSAYSDGGAIYNEAEGTVTIASSTVSGNTAKTSGGAVYNEGGLTVTGSTFTSNSAVTDAVDDEGNPVLTYGGAIYNEAEGTVTVTSSEITNNTASIAGAIYNAGTLTFDKATVSNNTATRYGGAIEATSDSNITITDSTFDSNKAKSWGGAIDNDGGELSISGSTFSNNEGSHGGAIATTAAITVDSSNFLNNKGVEDKIDNYGGAIYLATSPSTDVSNITNSTFDGNNNSTHEYGGESNGGAIGIGGFANLDHDTFTNNKSDNGGAIIVYLNDYDSESYSNVKITNSTFSKNISTDSGGAISNYAGVTIQDENGKDVYYGLTIDNTTFTENQATLSDQGSGGGAIFLGAKSLTKITNSSFDGNTSAGVGGAIASRDYTRGDNKNAKLDIDNTTFTNNIADSDGGAIYNSFYNSQENPDAVTIKNSTFDNNTSGGNGGAIYNEVKDRGGNLAEVTLTDTSFTNNTAKGNGGAIYANGDLSISAVAKNVVFSGNSATDGNDIYMNKVDGAETSELALNAADGKSITLADGISGNDTYNVNVNATVAGEDAVQNTGSVVLGGTVKNANIDVANGTLQLAQAGVLDSTSSLTIGSSVTLDSINSAIETFGTNVTLGADSILNADVDLVAKTADNFANATQKGNVTISNVNFLNATKTATGSINFDLAKAMGLKDATVSEELASQTTTFLNPIRYLTGGVSKDGMVSFMPTGNSYKDFNPAVLASPVAAQLGGYLTQLNSYDEAFRNMDMYMLMTKEQRYVLKNRNKFAISEGQPAYNSTYDSKYGWARPYATFENVRLKNGPKVSNVAYGSYFGGESQLYDLGHGWDGMLGVYVGYNGSHQAYNGIGIYQNGGTLGVTGMAYKGNFFTGLTINAGANVGEASTAYGDDNFTMLMAGIASKTGYNVELADGKFIIQPSFLMSYSFVNTFDYTNAAGVRIDSDPLHAIQLEPGLKFIGNLKNGWQPYVGVSMVWNIMDKTDFTANNVSLPEMSVKPYVKYGVGVRKTWGERLSGFIQAFFTNGGRNGLGLQAGFRFALGKEGAPVKVQNSKPELPKTKVTLSGLK